MATRLERAIDWGTKLPDRTVTYSFVPKGEKTPSPVGKVVSHGFNAYEKAQFEAAFAQFASFTNLRFREVDEASVADLYVSTYKETRTSLGAMGPPGYGDSAGYGAFNYRGIGWDRDQPGTGGLEKGGYGYITIIHELGHGLGLAHPHDNGGGSGIFPGVWDSGDRGRFGLNQGIYTMMSYNDGWETNPNGDPPNYDYGYEGTPMAIDIAVLQTKYGANQSYHAGDDVYLLPDVNQSGTYYSCIWDAGGRDAIVNPSDVDATIDLRAATLKPEPGGGGYLSHVAGIFGGFTIANRVSIEDARSGAGDDIITGNRAENRLDGGGGEDAIYGRGAADELLGGAGSDRLYGGRGADTLVSSSGGDIFKGGQGADVFEFDASPVAGVVATIVDLVPGVDVIRLAFGGLGSPGVLPASAFSAAGSVDAQDRILYDAETGSVSFDKDGTGPQASIKFAKVGAGLALSHTDFVVAA